MTGRPQPDVPGCIAVLTGALGTAALLTEAPDLMRYECGARYGSGQAAFVVRPASTTEVVQAVRICARHGVALVPQGANTGLVGASTPDASGGQAVLSLERMAKEIAINLPNRSVTAAAGVRLSVLNRQLAEHGLWFPIDLSADPALGGMVATNTGGTRCLRYGDVRRTAGAGGGSLGRHGAGPDPRATQEQHGL
jgi:FAD/FMN-containing dehydrogenase